MRKRPKTERRNIQAQLLRIHPTAQRRMVPAQLEKIIRALDLDCINTIDAVEYTINGIKALWVVDGQHRLAALLHEGLGQWEVDVRIHLDVTDDHGAHNLFIKLNTKATVAPFDTFANELGRGDSWARGAERIAAEHGLRIERSQADGVVQCVSTLKSVYNRDEGRALNLTVATVTAAWGKTATAVEGKIIDGVGRVFVTYNGAVDVPALVKKLAKYPGGPAGLLGAAKALRSIRSASLARCVEEVVVEEYNKGRRSHRLGEGA